ncbi:MAG: 30S ribosomal protein S5 [bacterium]|nr:30S ribosomal protein S5 [bacterium]
MSTDETKLNTEAENVEVATPELAEISPEVLEAAGVEVIAPIEIAVEAPVAKAFVKRQFDKGGRRGGNRKGPRREERVKPEFDQKIIEMRRVTRVVAGGRRMSFAVALVAGNRKGKVGVGTGKAGDTAAAIEKAFRDAKKNMMTVSLNKENSIAHDVKAKYSASVVMLMPARGRGLAAGGSVRSVLELAGVTDVAGKILSRSKNGLNNAQAAMKALALLRIRSKNNKQGK